MGISVVHWHNDVLVPTYVYYNFSKAEFTYRKISITSRDFNRSRILLEAAVTWDKYFL